MESTTVFPLHEHPEYLNPCALLLNDEWKRSLEARIHSLEKSSEKFPLSLIMVENTAAGELGRLLGHSRLTFIPGKAGGCFVESVIIDKSCRGKGYGRVLMEGTENCARERGFSEIFLSTHGERHFYQKLGYEYCSPVTTAGSNSQLHKDPRMADFLERMALANVNIVPLPEKATEDAESSKEYLEQSEQTASKPPPPPPPFLPQRPVIERDPKFVTYFMRKRL